MEQSMIQQRFEKYKKTLLENEKVIPCNKNKILEFVRFNQVTGKVKSYSRLSKLIWTMTNISEWLNKDFESVGKEDILNIVEHIDNNGYSYNTASDYKVIIKKFWKWFKGKNRAFPEEVIDINSKPKEEKLKTADQMLTESDVAEIVKHENDIRNKAVIMVLYETGTRASEFITLKVRDVIQEKNDFWYVSITQSKTIQRTIPIYDSIPFLKEWINKHPKPEPNEPLWHNLSYNNFQYVLRKAVQRCKINKPYNPHNWRHSAVTRDAKNYSDQQLKLKYGWSGSSRQLQTYSHLNHKDLVTAERKKRGLLEENEKPKNQPKKCEKCGELNSFASSFCVCGYPLDIAAIMEERKQDEVVNRVAISLLKKISELIGEDALRDELKKVVKEEKIKNL